MSTANFTHLKTKCLFIVFWSLLLILPHFLQNASIWSLFTSTFIFIGLFLLSEKYLVSLYTSPRTIKFYYFVSVLVVVFTIVSSLFSYSFPYRLISRLGSYTMFIDGELAIFGDLRHLTSAAGCPLNPEIGLNLCDPWGRVFNQNPDVVLFMKALGLTDVVSIGLIFLFGLFFIQFHVYKKLNNGQIIPWLLLLSPPMFLAIDRGNETLTYLLICLSLLLILKDSPLWVSTLPLFIAGFFKFWPMLIISFLCLLSFNSKKIERAGLGLIAIVFVLSKYHDLQMIAKFTQSGGPFGGSFGMTLLKTNSFYMLSQVLIAFILVLFIYRFGFSSAYSPHLDPKLESFTVSLMLTYVVICFSGEHFMYRFIFLIPITFLVNPSNGGRRLIVFIFVMFYLARFPVVSAASVSLIILFVIYSVVSIIYSLKLLEIKSR